MNLPPPPIQVGSFPPVWQRWFVELFRRVGGTDGSNSADLLLLSNLADGAQADDPALLLALIPAVEPVAAVDIPSVPHELGDMLARIERLEQAAWAPQADTPLSFSALDLMRHQATPEDMGVPVLASGRYTPTLTAVANVTGSTAYKAQWLRVGKCVCVSGIVDVDPTTAGLQVRLGVSLPVSSSIGNAIDCTGAAGANGVQGQVGAIRGDAVNKRAELSYMAASDANASMHFTFLYEVF